MKFPYEDTISSRLIKYMICPTAYILLAKIGLYFATLNAAASPVWPATGFGIALVYFWGMPYAGVIFVGNLLINSIWGTNTVWISFVMAMGNSLEALIGAYLLKNVFKELPLLKRTLASLHLEISRMLMVGVAAPLVSATFGVLALWWGNLIESNGLVANFITWWIGNFLGFILFFPITMVGLRTASEKKLWNHFGKRIPRILIVLILNLAVVHFVFNTTMGTSMIFLFFPVLLFSALLDSESSICFSIPILTFGSAYGTAMSQGPFVWAQTNENLMALEIFLFAVGITALVLFQIGHYLKNKNVQIILMIVWTLSGLVFFLQDRSKNERDYKYKEDLQVKFSKSITERMEDYENILTSITGLFVSSQSVSRDEFHSFANTIDVTKKFPGVRGIGFIKKIHKSKVAQFEKELKEFDSTSQVRNVPQTNFYQFTTEKSDSMYVIQYIEPYEKNKSALGLVVSSEQSRKTAADLAAATKSPTVTGNIQLVQSAKQKIGMLMFVPIWKNEILLGWAYAPFVFEEFFLGLKDKFSNDLSFEIHDPVEQGQANSLLFDSRMVDTSARQDRTRDVIRIQVYNRAFDIHFYRSTSFQSAKNASVAWVGALGALLALVCAWMYVNTLIYKDHADQIIKTRSEELIQSAKMASLGQMASGMAHEINNPLAIIAGKAYVLKAHLKKFDNIPKEFFDEIIKIEVTAMRISKIIRGLKSFSRESSQDPMTTNSLTTLIDDSLEFCKEKLKNYGVELEIVNSTPLEISCRPSQISQVLLNLLNNSLDAIENLPYKKITISTQLLAESVQIVVSDSGPGIPPEILGKIMEPFFSTKPINKGTGLGLSISKGIVEAHGGRLYYEKLSANDLTKFIIELPRSQT